MRFNRIFALLFVLSCIGLSCNSEPKKPEATDLILGKWEIESGFRNGKKANSLEGLFFEFQEDGKMMTNLLGKETTSNYELKDQKLIQSGDTPMEYDIRKLDENALHLTMTMRGFDFALILKKK